MAETPETLRADADFVERNWASMGVVSFGDLGRRIRAHADAWEAERAADKARIAELEREVAAWRELEIAEEENDCLCWSRNCEHGQRLQRARDELAAARGGEQSGIGCGMTELP